MRIAIISESVGKALGYSFQIVVFVVLFMRLNYYCCFYGGLENVMED